MAENGCDDGSDNVSWNTDDDLDFGGSPGGATSALANGRLENHYPQFSEASSSAGPSNSHLFHQFVRMGFSEELVTKAIEENGTSNEGLILEALLTYVALENSQPNEGNWGIPLKREQDDDSDPKLDNDSDPKLDTDSDPKIDDDSDPKIDTDSSSDYLRDGFSDADSCPGLEVNPTIKLDPEVQERMMQLEEMGYAADEANLAIERCGLDATMEELTNFICAAQIAREADYSYVDPIAELKNITYGKHNKRKPNHELGHPKKKQACLTVEEDTIQLPNPMIGYGVPSMSLSVVHRDLPEGAMGPPYFYYENVALTPKGVWDTISRHLFDVEPEFVDSRYFCAAARKRGYIHNLPLENRFPLVPSPPQTIQEALPLSRKWWPTWDPRTKLNCLQTVCGSAQLTNRIRKALENCEGDPPLHVQKYVLYECRKWNLVWVGRNKLAPLEPDEVEMLLGFPRNHTRGGGISRTDRYKSLGNSFQVDTVAYQLSVLRELFPGGINMLSLFSGIGGGEVALHRLGVKLNVVVSVEKSEVNRDIVKSWWEQTNQRGTLIHFSDVQDLSPEKLEQLVSTFGRFDLVIGGSPCNNLTGSNRVSRDGLEGTESSLFFEYIRILDTVKVIMRSRR